MVFFKRFEQWKIVFQGGAEGARNALFGGKKWAASAAFQAHGLISNGENGGREFQVATASERRGHRMLTRFRLIAG